MQWGVVRKFVHCARQTPRSTPRGIVQSRNVTQVGTREPRFEVCQQTFRLTSTLDDPDEGRYANTSILNGGGMKHPLYLYQLVVGWMPATSAKTNSNWSGWVLTSAGSQMVQCAS